VAVIGVSVDLAGLHMASDRDFNRKSFTTGHTGFSIPFTTWPDRADVPRNAARALRYMDRFVTVTQGEVFYATEALARLEGMERGPAGNTSLAAALALARELDRDATVVVQETEYTGAGKHPLAQLGLARRMGVRVERGDPVRSRAGESIVIPERPSRLGVLRDYLLLGVEHIASGLDHLLFVFGLLVLVAARTGPLVKTVTAFTVGHSVTLSLAVLGFVAFPSGLIELAIAASIFVLGAELVHTPGERPGMLRRFPWAMAGAFGLLHGFGFAGALAEVGLPSGEIPLALFAFNVGIELGQLAFIGLVLVAWRLVVHVQVPLPTWSHALPAYGIGCLAAYWCIERAAGLIP